MASENYVSALGLAVAPAAITTVNGIKQASLDLFCLRKRQHTLAGEDETDIINVFTKDPEIISVMKRIRENEVISIIGTFCSVDIPKSFACENKDCKDFNKPVEYKGCVSYVNPIEIMPIAWSSEATAVDMKLFLHKFREHSNTVRLIGRACGEEKHVPLEVKNKQSGEKELLHLWQVRMRIKRKKLVANSLSTADFITISSYEELPKINAGDFLAVNGFLKTKVYNKTRKCPCCGEKIKTSDSSMSVVPYTIEHIKGVKEE